MKEIILETKELSKSYQKNTIFHDLNLTLYKGDILALSSGNGTGKTTLLKILCNIMKPSQGKVITAKNLKFQYIPERFAQSNLTISEFIPLFCAIEGMEEERINEVSRYYYDLFSMKDMLNTPLKYLSKGTLQKVSVIQALMCPCDILLLDEPLSGQDFNSQRQFVKEMKEKNKEGLTIVMACHEPHLIGQLANRVIEVQDKVWVEHPIEKKEEQFLDVVLLEGSDFSIQHALKDVTKYQLYMNEDYHTLIIKKTETRKFLQMLLNRTDVKVLDLHNFGKDKEDESYAISLYQINW